MVRFTLAVGLVAVLVLLPAAAQQPVLQLAVPGGAPLAPGRPGSGPDAKPAVSDEDALKAAGLSPTDGEKLVGYIKLRTVSDADQGKIQTLIKKLGAEQFDDRIKAGEELENFGPAAIGLLKNAEKDADPEVAYQAGRVLKRMEKVPHGAAAAAAVRAVVKLKPPGASEALLAFLPMADTEALSDDIRGALVALAAPNGKADPAIVAALSDASPIRRGAAYIALIEGGNDKERIRVPDAYEQVKAAIRKETDSEQRFRGIWALLQTTKEKEFIPDLIAMIPQLPRGRIWQLEDLLLQLAGKHPEGGRFGKSPESLVKARDAWDAWWKAQNASVDLVKSPYKPRIQGITDIIEMDRSGYNRNRYVSLGPDMKEKCSFSSTSLFDAKLKPDGKVVTVENYSQVLERDQTGAITHTHNMNQPMTVHPEENGKLLVIARQFICELDKNYAQSWIYQRQNVADILAGARMPNGDTIFITNTQQGDNCFRLDAKGKLLDKKYTVGRMQNFGFVQSIAVTGDETILVCEADKVSEWDLKTGKSKWTFSINMPTGVQRLPNGNTLIASTNQNRLVEVDPSNEVVWEYRAKEGLSVSKAYRR
jgi:hypothetical protein